jgi:hypothetical protein
MLSGIRDLECKYVKKLGQCHLTLFIGARKSESWHAFPAKLVEKNTLELF